MALLNAPSSGFDVLLETLMRKEQLSQQKEDLNLRRKNFEFEQEQAQIQRQREQDIINGARIGAQLALLQPDVAQGKLSGVSPQYLPSAIETLQQVQQTGGAIQGQAISNQRGAVDLAVDRETAGARARTIKAGATSAETEARVGSATADTRVAREGVGLEADRANLLNTNLRNQLTSKVLANDPERGGQAINAWINSNGQLTLEESLKAFGMPVPEGMNGALRFQAPARMSAEAARASGFLPLMKESNDTINQLNARGVRVSFGSALKQGTRHATFDALINATQSPEQQELVQANRAFSDMYRFSLSGQASSEPERMAMMLSITEQFSDSDAVIAQKRRLRDLMVRTQESVIGGGVSALEAAQAASRIAAGLGDPDIDAAFQSMIDDIQSGAASNVPGLGATGVAGVSSLIDRGLRP